MDPYTGHNSIKMFMKNKHILFCFKQCVMASSGENYAYCFDLYLGKSATYNMSLDLGGSVVKKLINQVEELLCSHIYLNNFFT